LDLHTPYTYWVISEFFHDWCFVLQIDGQSAGFVTCVQRDSTLFLWQVGILPEYRRHGYSRLLYAQVLDKALCQGIDVITTTIADDNVASRVSMESFFIRSGGTMRAVGTVELLDDTDPGFSEVETKYVITVGEV